MKPGKYFPLGLEVNCSSSMWESSYACELDRPALHWNLCVQRRRKNIFFNLLDFGYSELKELLRIFWHGDFSQDFETWCFQTRKGILHACRVLFLVGAFSLKEKSPTLTVSSFFSVDNLTLSGPLFLQFVHLPYLFIFHLRPSRRAWVRFSH